MSNERKSVRWLPFGRNGSLWLLFLFLLGSGPMALTQLPTATILGTVRDTSGAVVPGASVVARSLETGQARKTVTAQDGSYRFPALAVGATESCTATGTAVVGQYANTGTVTGEPPTGPPVTDGMKISSSLPFFSR